MIEAIIIGFWAWLYIGKLVSPEDIFEFMPEVTNRLSTLGKHGALDSYDRNWIQNALCRWAYECEVCHAGIFALVVFPFRTDGWEFWNHFEYLTVAMVTAYVLSMIKEMYL